MTAEIGINANIILATLARASGRKLDKSTMGTFNAAAHTYSVKSVINAHIKGPTSNDLLDVAPGKMSLPFEGFDIFGSDAFKHCEHKRRGVNTPSELSAFGIRSIPEKNDCDAFVAFNRFNP